LCEVPGGPGWENQVRPGGGSSIVGTATTPQACCQACVAALDCAQWAMAVSGGCQLNILPNACLNNPLIDFVDSGRIRCP
jgi:hypothetical protein